jgi:hypothetical protein
MFRAKEKTTAYHVGNPHGGVKKRPQHIMLEIHMAELRKDHSISCWKSTWRG